MEREKDAEIERKGHREAGIERKTKRGRRSAGERRGQEGEDIKQRGERRRRRVKQKEEERNEGEK